jgi:hypothetical protein
MKWKMSVFFSPEGNFCAKNFRKKDFVSIKGWHKNCNMRIMKPKALQLNLCFHRLDSVFLLYLDKHTIILMKSLDCFS